MAITTWHTSRRCGSGRAGRGNAGYRFGEPLGVRCPNRAASSSDARVCRPRNEADSPEHDPRGRRRSRPATAAPEDLRRDHQHQERQAEEDERREAEHAEAEERLPGVEADGAAGALDDQQQRTRQRAGQVGQRARRSPATARLTTAPGGLDAERASTAPRGRAAPSSAARRRRRGPSPAWAAASPSAAASLEPHVPVEARQRHDVEGGDEDVRGDAPFGGRCSSTCTVSTSASTRAPTIVVSKPGSAAAPGRPPRPCGRRNRPAAARCPGPACADHSARHCSSVRATMRRICRMRLASPRRDGLDVSRASPDAELQLAHRLAAVGQEGRAPRRAGRSGRAPASWSRSWSSSP